MDCMELTWGYEQGTEWAHSLINPSLITQLIQYPFRSKESLLSFCFLYSECQMVCYNSSSTLFLKKLTIAGEAEQDPMLNSQ